MSCMENIKITQENKGIVHSIRFEEGFTAFITKLCFAVLDTTYTMYNYHTFLDTFKKFVIPEQGGEVK